jgi:CRP-like cAMP-binding protein
MSSSTTELPEAGVVASLSTGERAILHPYGDVIHHEKGGLVVEQGVVQSFLHLVLEGELQVKVRSEEAIVPLGYVQAGQCVGEMSLLEPAEASAFVSATAPTTVWCISRLKFDKFVEEHPRIACKLLKSIAMLLADRLRKGSQRLLDAEDG